MRRGKSLLQCFSRHHRTSSALYEVVQGYGEGWKKVWKWTLPVTRDGGGQVLARSGVSRDELRPPRLPLSHTPA